VRGRAPGLGLALPPRFPRPVPTRMPTPGDPSVDRPAPPLAAGDERSDEELVAACAGGEAAALATLFDRHHRQVFRFVSRIVGSAASDVDDLVQSTFLEVWRASPGFRQRGSARGWVLGIASNLVRHRNRSEARRQSAMLGLAEAPVAPSARPDDAARQSQILEWVGAALQTLPHDLRVAFVLCDVEEISAVEAARILQVPEGTMWRRLHIARKRLRATLAKVLP
jgi:RNA polymerase sigma-70 factor, ECF subfamily